MTVLFVIAGLILGNFIAKPAEIAIERSYFQLVAIGVVLLAQWLTGKQ